MQPPHGPLRGIGLGDIQLPETILLDRPHTGMKLNPTSGPQKRSTRERGSHLGSGRSSLSPRLRECWEAQHSRLPSRAQTKEQRHTHGMSCPNC